MYEDGYVKQVAGLSIADLHTRSLAIEEVLAYGLIPSKEVEQFKFELFVLNATINERLQH